MEYVTVARLLSTQGLKGAFHAASLTSFPEERFRLRTKLSLHDPKTDARKDVTLNYVRIAGNGLVLGFEEIPSIDEAEQYLKWDVDLEKEKAPMPKGSYRLADLIGCEVRDSSGKKLGVVSDVFSYSPTWTFRVSREGEKDFFVPFIDDFVKSIDIENKVIVIEPCEGML